MSCRLVVGSFLFQTSILTLSLLVEGTPVYALDRAAEEQGIKDMTERIQKNPKDAMAYVRRAGHHLALQPKGFDANRDHSQAAIADIETAHQLAPNDFYVRHNYAHMAYLQRKYGLAVSEFTKALALKPNSRSYMGRAWAQAGLGKYAEAQQDFDQALKLNPSPSLKGVIQREIEGLHRIQADQRALEQTLDAMSHMGEWSSGLYRGPSTAASKDECRYLGGTWEHDNRPVSGGYCH